VICATASSAIAFSATAETTHERQLSQTKKGQPEADAERLTELLEERLDWHRKRLAALQAIYEDADESEKLRLLDLILSAARSVLAAELDVCDVPAKRIAAHKKYVDLAKEMESRVETLFTLRRRGGEAERHALFKAIRIEAEIGLLRERLRQADK